MKWLTVGATLLIAACGAFALAATLDSFALAVAGCIVLVAVGVLWTAYTYQDIPGTIGINVLLVLVVIPIAAIVELLR